MYTGVYRVNSCFCCKKIFSHRNWSSKKIFSKYFLVMRMLLFEIWKRNNTFAKCCEQTLHTKKYCDCVFNGDQTASEPTKCFSVLFCWIKVHWSGHRNYIFPVFQFHQNAPILSKCSNFVKTL